MLSFRTVLSAQHRIESAVEEASPSLSRVGRWMSSHPIRTLSHSAEEIALLTGTSVAAVNRFARAAGFEGFTHLKTQLGDELQSNVAPLRKLAAARPKAAGHTARKSAPSIDADALEHAIAAPEIARVAGRLLKSRQVLVLGFGTSGYLA